MVSSGRQRWHFALPHLSLQADRLARLRGLHRWAGRLNGAEIALMSEAANLLARNEAFGDDLAALVNMQKHLRGLVAETFGRGDEAPAAPVDMTRFRMHP